MEEIDFKKYQAAWKSEQSFEEKTLSEAAIQGFLKKKSKEINKLFKKGLIFDIVLKSTLGVSFIILSFLMYNSLNIVIISSFMFAGIILAISFQVRMLKKIPYADYSRDNLRTILKNNINFYTKKYLNSLYVGALSNSLFIISASLYYYYFKYGEVRPFETDDYLVFGIIIIIGFVLGAFAQIKHHNFQIQQLEHSLTEIDENTINELSIKTQNNRRRQLFMIYLLAIICGLLVLAFILTRIW
jgi:hypothetical protein